MYSGEVIQGDLHHRITQLIPFSELNTGYFIYFQIQISADNAFDKQIPQSALLIKPNGLNMLGRETFK